VHRPMAYHFPTLSILNDPAILKDPAGTVIHRTIQHGIIGQDIALDQSERIDAASDRPKACDGSAGCPI
jgi:hypothetical protein